MRPTQKGFTLIEVMIVVVIVGILAAIAIPNYQDSIRKTRRADAEGALMGLRQAMERHYTKVYTYRGAAQNGADTGLPGIFATQSPVEGGTAHYQLRIIRVSDIAYILEARPLGDQANDQCGRLRLWNTGRKSSRGAVNARCWED